MRRSILANRRRSLLGQAAWPRGLQVVELEFIHLKKCCMIVCNPPQTASGLQPTAGVGIPITLNAVAGGSRVLPIGRRC